MVAGKLEVLGRGERRAARNDERRGRGEATKRQSDAPPPPEATPPPPPPLLHLCKVGAGGYLLYSFVRPSRARCSVGVHLCKLKLTVFSRRAFNIF